MLFSNHSRVTILESLLSQPKSLADLHAAVPVSLPTLRRLVQELSDTHWVRIVGQKPTTGGRPAALYGLNDETYIVIGVHLQFPGVRLVATSLNGDVLDEHFFSDNEQPSPQHVLQEITRYVHTVRHLYPERTILGLGIATPGYVDANTGEILTIGRVPEWQNFPLRNRLVTQLGLPITIDNDFDSIASAELRFADAPNSDDLLYLGFSEGIKVSMFLRGELYKGPFGNAGILGRNKLTIGDQVPYLEEIVSVSAICKAYLKFQPKLPVAFQTMAQKFQYILDLADEGDAVAYPIVSETIHILAQAVGNMLYLVQPNVLLIGGALSTMPDGLFTELENAIRHQLPSVISNSLVIERAKLTAPNNVAIGATHQFLRTYITSNQFEVLMQEKA